MVYSSCFEKKKEKASTREVSGKGGTENEESKSIELRPTSEIESSALHYNLVVRNCKQTTAAKRAV